MVKAIRKQVYDLTLADFDATAVSLASCPPRTWRPHARGVVSFLAL